MLTTYYILSCLQERGDAGDLSDNRDAGENNLGDGRNLLDDGDDLLDNLADLKLRIGIGGKGEMVGCQRG